VELYNSIMEDITFACIVTINPARDLKHIFALIIADKIHPDDMIEEGALVMGNAIDK
jgi:hypothetical protein